MAQVDWTENPLLITRALMVRRPYIDFLLDGTKAWEIRGTGTRLRGWIALCASGTGEVHGVVRISDCVGPLGLSEYRGAAHLHLDDVSRVRKTADMPYRRTHGWVMSDPIRLLTPVRYAHPSGAVTWVQLDQKAVDGLRRELLRSSLGEMTHAS